MEFKRVNHLKKYLLLSKIWDSSMIGKGTLSRFLSKFLIPNPKDAIISKTIYGFDLLINPAIDNGVEHSLYYFGTYEKGTLNFIKTHLTEGQIFFDIGANIGLMSIFASYCVGKSGKVYAFEANPETAKLLKYNIELNNISNINIVDKAAGNNTGKITIYNHWTGNRGGATLIKPDKETESFEVDLIKIDTVDEYLSINIGMMKIDVEGFEMDVLKGLEKILRKDNPPKLIVECSADRNNNYDSVYEIYNFVKKINKYKVYKLSKGKERFGELVEINSATDLPKHDNIFCI
jgi:FkbM family methyltransferase